MRNSKGFTLIELIVVIAVLGIFAAILVPSIGNYINKANLSVAHSNGATALEACQRLTADIENGGNFSLNSATIKENSNLTVNEGEAAIDNSIVVKIVGNSVNTLWSMKSGQLAMWTTDRGWVFGLENVSFEEDEWGELSFGLANENTAYIVTNGRSFSKAVLNLPSSYKGLPVIGVANNAFNGCTSITSVTLASSYTFIGVSTFNGCSSLNSVTIPSSVTSIGNNAFNGCTTLDNVYVRRSVSDQITAGGTNMFQNCPSAMNIYVPSDSVNAYKTAEGWKKDSTKIKAS